MLEEKRGVLKIGVDGSAWVKAIASRHAVLGVTEGGLVTPVLGGENNGRQLRHAAVVRSISSLGRLDPRRPGEYSAVAQLNLRQDWDRSNLRLVLFVQDRVTRHILGAASVKP